MNVTVQYFAAFREQAGCAEEEVNSNQETAGELFGELAARHGFKDPQARCKVAVNDSLARWGQRLADGDTVLFFPPVAGG